MSEKKISLREFLKTRSHYKHETVMLFKQRHGDEEAQTAVEWQKKAFQVIFDLNPLPPKEVYAH